MFHSKCSLWMFIKCFVEGSYQNVPLKLFLIRSRVFIEMLHSKCSLWIFIKWFLSNCFSIRKNFYVEDFYQNDELEMFSINIKWWVKSCIKLFHLKIVSRNILMCTYSVPCIFLCRYMLVLLAYFLPHMLHWKWLRSSLRWHATTCLFILLRCGCFIPQ